MQLIFGLGNPGDKYKYTRHNAGFLFLNQFQKTKSFPVFEFNSKFNGDISLGKIANRKTMLVKPQTFMNLSGKTVQALLAFYKLSLNNIVVIHDDLDIPLGTYKTSTDSSSAGHHGVQNIIDLLGTQNFTRIRLGIGKPPKEKESCLISGKDYVLQKFSTSELTILKKTFPSILTNLKKIIHPTQD